MNIRSAFIFYSEGGLVIIPLQILYTNMGSSNAEARDWSRTRMLCFICHVPAASAFADKIEMQGYWEKIKRRRRCPSGQLHGGESFILVDANQRSDCLPVWKL